MKIVSFNVNGLRAIHRKSVLNQALFSDADLICLQEVKAQWDQVEDLFVSYPFSVLSFFSAEKKGYSGVCFLVQDRQGYQEIDVSEWMLDYLGEGRVQACRYGDTVVINVYVPSLSSVFETDRWDERLNYKRCFLIDLAEMSAFFVQQGLGVVICGDFNVAHHEIDLARPVANRGRAGFTEEERSYLDIFEQKGYNDVFRLIHPDKKDVYSWWSYRGRARLNNIGWRLDYFWIDEGLKSRVISCTYAREILGSDHCPLILEIDENEGIEGV